MTLDNSDHDRSHSPAVQGGSEKIELVGTAVHNARTGSPTTVGEPRRVAVIRVYLSHFPSFPRGWSKLKGKSVMQTPDHVGLCTAVSGQLWSGDDSFWHRRHQAGITGKPTLQPRINNVI